MTGCLVFVSSLGGLLLLLRPHGLQADLGLYPSAEAATRE